MIEIEPVIARALGIEVKHVSDDLRYQSIPEWSSLRHVALMIALEREFGIKITDELTLQLHSVGAIRKFARMRATNPDVPARPQAERTEPAAIMVYRGLEKIHIDRSTITHIDGEHGILEHRGYSIHQLVEHSSFEETSWLLIHGDLPDAATLQVFQEELRSYRHLPSSVVDLIHSLAHCHPMDVLRTSVSALGALGSNARDDSPEGALHAGIKLIAQVPTLIATHQAIRSGRDPLEPTSTSSHAGNFLHLLSGEEPSPDAVRIIDRDLIVHADHGSNASTLAARVVIGCRADLYAAVTAAIAAFTGPLHGGAAERVVELVDAVGTPENAEAYVRDCLNRNEPVMGFGHRVYRTEDPRVCHLREAARKLGRERKNLRGFEIVEAVVKAMEPYARHGVEPNVDLYAGLVYRLLGIPDDLAAPMFVAGRMAGWVAQALEQRSNNVLIRPLLQYVGAKSRKYRPLRERF